MLAAFLFLPSISPSVHAAAGTVCLIDPTASSCPTSPASLMGTAGTQQRVSVFLQGTNVINGFDITLLADHTILKPAGFDLTGSILPGPQQVVVECLSGVLVTGNICSTTDTIDTLHLAVVACRMYFVCNNRLLVTAIYNVTASTNGIPLGFQTGCSNTSVSNTCVNIANGTPTPVPETVQTATFSTGTTSDFALTANPTTLTLKHGSQGTSAITLTSVGGFAGTVSLSSSVSPGGHHGPTDTLSASSVTLSSGGTGSVVVTISTTKHTVPGTYTITINGTSGSISNSISITVTVT